MSPKKSSLHPLGSHLVLALVAGSSLFPSGAHAFLVNPVRCTNDSVGQPEAVGRNEWFKKCQPDLYRFVFSEGEYTQNHVKYATRNYVTYGVSHDDGTIDYPGNWMAPSGDPTKNWTPPDCTVPANYVPIGVCTSGCYAPDQTLETELGLIAIKSAMENGVANVVTLRADSSREAVRTQLTPVRNYLTDIKDEEQELLKFRTLGGGSIEVTTEHPLLDGEGRMRRAKTLQPGDALVLADGTPDPIVSITGRSFYGKVYNVAVRSTDDLENIVIAQGFLNGTLYYQNEAGVEKLNQVIFRQSVLPADLAE